MRMDAAEQNRKDTIICGIDPGLRIMGYAILRVIEDQPSVVDAGVCRFDESRPLADRLVSIESDITAILTEHQPAVVAVEQLYSHYNHPQTAILMGHARGVILMSAAKLHIEVRSYAATKIKKFLTGKGRASKSQMQRAVQSSLGLTTLPEPPDVADALAIAMCCASELHRLQPVEMTG